MHLLVDSVSKTISLTLVLLANEKRFRYKNKMVFHDLSKVYLSLTLRNSLLFFP